MTFSHPLARSTKVFVAHSHHGMEQQILVIVTTVELDPQSGRYKKRLVEKLSSRRARLCGQVGPRDGVPADDPTERLAAACGGLTLSPGGGERGLRS